MDHRNQFDSGGDGEDQSGPEMPFWARVSAYDGSKYYAWTEVVRENSDDYAGSPGQFVDAVGGRYGTLTNGPAVDPNGEEIALGAYVRLVRAAYSPTVDWIYLVISAQREPVVQIAVGVAYEDGTFAATVRDYYNNSGDLTLPYGASWHQTSTAWAYDLTGQVTLIVSDKYPGVYLGRRVGGPYFVSIVADNLGNPLDDDASWIEVVGPIAPVAWSAVTAYVVGNLVDDGGTFFCIADNTNQEPPDPTYWLEVDLVVQNGYSSTTTYDAGEYVQEIRPFYAIKTFVGTDPILGPQLRLADGAIYNGTFDANLLTIDPLTDIRTPVTAIWGINLSNATVLVAGDDYLCHDEGEGPGGPFIMAIASSTGVALTDPTKWTPLVSDPTSPLAYAASVVASIAIANGPQTVASDPGDFASTISYLITDADSSITAGTITTTGTDSGGFAMTDSITLSTLGTHTYVTASAFKTISSVVVSGLVGAGGSDTIQGHITLYPVGVLRTNGGNTYTEKNVAGTTGVPGSSADWVLTSPSDSGGYDDTTPYTAGDYVQEIREKYAFNSAIQSINGVSYSDAVLESLDGSISFDYPALGTINLEVVGANIDDIVNSLNGLTGNLTIAGDDVITATPSGTTITLTAASASTTFRGVMNGTTQSMSGVKTWLDDQYVGVPGGTTANEEVTGTAQVDTQFICDNYSFFSPLMSIGAFTIPTPWTPSLTGGYITPSVGSGGDLGGWALHNSSETFPIVAAIGVSGTITSVPHTYYFAIDDHNLRTSMSMGTEAQNPCFAVITDAVTLVGIWIGTGYEYSWSPYLGPPPAAGIGWNAHVAGGLVVDPGSATIPTDAGGMDQDLTATGPGTFSQSATGTTPSVTQQADISALTNSTGGTPSLTINAVSGTGDDATINDNLASLLAQINALRTALEAANLMA